MSWNLEELRNLINNKYGNEYLENANPHINSVDWKIKIAGYHSCESKKAFDDLFNNVENEAIQAVKLTLSSDDDASKIYRARLVAEAHLIACAQSMHSVSDVIAHVIFHSLKMNDISRNDISLSAISKKLKDSSLKEEITKLLGLREFGYLKDFVNTTKHISLVFSGYNVNLEDVCKQEHGLKFSSFSYQARNSNKIRSHPEKWHYTFLKELEKVSIQYVVIGQEINKYVHAQQ